MYRMCREESSSEGADHGLINYKDTKTKCRLYWCSVEFIDLRYSQSCWNFRPSFVNYCSLTFFLVHPPPPVKVQYILAMSNQRSFKFESFRFPAFVPKKIEYIPFCNKILDRNKTFSISTRKFRFKRFCSAPFSNFFETIKSFFCL
jgi:hypothetical protein